MFLPALTLGLVNSAPILRLTRASMLESLGSDAVLYADACGLRRDLVIRYALRQSMTLIVTYLGESCWPRCWAATSSLSRSTPGAGSDNSESTR